MRAKQFSSLFHRLGFRFIGLILVVAIAAGGAIGTVLIRISHDSMYQEALNNNLYQAKLIADMAASYIDVAQAQLRIFAARPDVRQAVMSNSFEQLQPAISQFAQIQTSLDSVGVYDINGIQRATSVLSTIGHNFSSENWFQQAMTTGSSFLDKPVNSNVTGRPAVPYAVPVLDNNGQIRGLIVGAISLETLSHTLLRVDNPLGTTAYLVYLQDKPLIMASSTSANILTNIDAGNKAVSSLISGKSGAVEITNYQEAELAGFSPVANLPMGVVLYTPSKTALSVVNTLVFNAILFTTLIVSVAVAIGVIMVRKVTRPIHQLVAASAAIGKGNLDYKIDTGDRGEIGELSSSILTMAQNLKTTLVSRDKLLFEVEQRQKAEERLFDLSRHLESILGTVPDIIIESDSKGAFTWANSEAIEFFGPELIGKQNVDYLCEQKDPSHSTTPVTLKASPGTDYCETWQRRRDGEKRLLAWWRREIKHNRGKVTGFLLAAQDITERYQAEKENEQLRNKTESLSRLATVGEMAAGIAHEINNPLAGVIGYAELLAGEPNVPDNVKQDIKKIHAASQRVKDIVKRMLTFARQQKPVQAIVNINELVDNTFAMREYVLKTANIQVITDYDTELPFIEADPGQLQQVFLNIIINAEYAMKKYHNGGTLTVSSRRSGDGVCIIFKDDGPGIKTEIKEKLFQPFFTTKAPGEGTGLGLSVSHSIILEHGGTIEVESEPGLGASFIIRLPIKEYVDEEIPEKKAAVFGLGQNI